MREASIRVFVASLALCAASCGPVTTMRRVGAVVPCRPSGCSFDVVTSRPAREYRVVAVLDLDAFAVKKIPNTEEAFRNAVAKDVCRVGGDGVIPGINVDGRYILATVIAWLPDFLPPIESTIPSGGTTPPASDAAPPHSGIPHDAPIVAPLTVPAPAPALPITPTEGCGGTGPC